MGKSARVIFIEHDSTDFAPLASSLKAQGFQALRIDSDSAVSYVARSPPDVVIVGKLSDTQSRGEFCRALRSASRDAPTLLLVSLASSSRILRDYIIEQGADDCLGTPLTDTMIVEYMAAAKMRPAMSPGRVLRYSELEMRVEDGKVFYGAARIPLRPSVVGLMRFFMENPERVHSAELLADVIGKQSLLRPHLAVAARVKCLRFDLSRKGLGGLIRTIPSKGYALAMTNIRVTIHPEM